MNISNNIGTLYKYAINSSIENDSNSPNTGYSRVAFNFLFSISLQEDLNVYLLLRLKFPAIFGWLRWFACGRRMCLICGEPETMTGKWHICDTIGCVYVHCEQCWKDVGVCYACSEIFNDGEDDNNRYNTLKGYVDTGYSE